MSVLKDDVDAAKGAAALLLTSPGVPVIFYGEEIGQLGQRPDEDIRRPMQWSAEADGGFTPSAPWLGSNLDYAKKNLAAQSTDPTSLLALYRTLIYLRNNHAALRVGDFYRVATGDKAVFASLRVSRQETILVVINLGQKPVSDYALKLEQGSLAGQYDAAPLLDAGELSAPAVTAQGGLENYKPLPELPPHSQFILQLQSKTK